MTIKKSARRAVYERDGLKCRYCGKQLKTSFGRPFVINGPDSLIATIDHVVPRAKGGTNAQTNLVTSCWPCNLEKGDGDAK